MTKIKDRPLPGGMMLSELAHRVGRGTYPESRLTHPKTLDGVLDAMDGLYWPDDCAALAKPLPDEERGSLLDLTERDDRWDGAN